MHAKSAAPFRDGQPNGRKSEMAFKPKLKGHAPELIKPRKPKILVYGASGVGKTWAALDFPDVYMIDVEGGATQPEYREKLAASGGLYLGRTMGRLRLMRSWGRYAPYRPSDMTARPS